jgi:hypothetical protein
LGLQSNDKKVIHTAEKITGCAQIQEIEKPVSSYKHTLSVVFIIACSRARFVTILVAYLSVDEAIIDILLNLLYTQRCAQEIQSAGCFQKIVVAKNLENAIWQCF